MKADIDLVDAVRESIRDAIGGAGSLYYVDDKEMRRIEKCIKLLDEYVDRAGGYAIKCVTNCHDSEVGVFVVFDCDSLNMKDDDLLDILSMSSYFIMCPVSYKDMDISLVFKGAIKRKKYFG